MECNLYCTYDQKTCQDSTSTTLQSVAPLPSVQKPEQLSKDVQTVIVSLVPLQAKIDNLKATLMLWEDSDTKISIEAVQNMDVLCSIFDLKHLEAGVKSAKCGVNHIICSIDPESQCSH